MPIKSDEPIFFLLQRVSNKLQENDGKVRRRDLFINGIHIQDPRHSISKYRIFGNTLTYRSSGEDEVTVFVRTLSGKTLPIACGPLCTVKDLKNMIYKLDHVPLEYYTLLSGGKVLEDDKMLTSYDIGECSTLHTAPRLRGGLARTGIEFVDVSDTSAVIKCEFSNKAPKGRMCNAGTNIECRCECTPSYDVIVPMGFGSIEICETTFRCPNCEKVNTITPVTTGFMKCKYRFHGIKRSNEQYTSEWTDVTEDDKYQLFEPHNKTTWLRLVIESAKLDEVEDCAICLSPMGKKNTKRLGCGHLFHATCYSKWNLSCPTCRFNQHLLR